MPLQYIWTAATIFQVQLHNWTIIVEQSLLPYGALVIDREMISRCVFALLHAGPCLHNSHTDAMQTRSFVLPSIQVEICGTHVCNVTYRHLPLTLEELGREMERKQNCL